MQFGAQGIPGITFLLILAPFLADFSMIFKRFGKLVFTYPRYIFYHALSLFATLSGPPCHYRYIPESVRRTLKVVGVPFRGSWEGESPRGGVTLILGGRPWKDSLPFGSILTTISTFKNSVTKPEPKIEPKSSPKEAQGRSRGGSYRFWYHFSSHLGSFLGAHGPLKNSWKCVTIITFKGLAPSRQGPFSRPFPGLLFFTLFSLLGTSLLHFWGPGLEKVTKWEPQWSPKIV